MCELCGREQLQAGVTESYYGVSFAIVRFGSVGLRAVEHDELLGDVGVDPAMRSDKGSTNEVAKKNNRGEAHVVSVLVRLAHGVLIGL